MFPVPVCYNGAMFTEQERRQFPRADVAFDLKYSVGPEAAYLTLSRDVSNGGISFQTDELQHLGTPLDLRLCRTGRAEILSAAGRVVRSWREGPASFAAVAFTNIDADRLHKILRQSGRRAG